MVGMRVIPLSWRVLEALNQRMPLQETRHARRADSRAPRAPRDAHRGGE
jgi:hypothetical protein